MLYLLVEDEFKNYPWCHRALRGLNEEVRRKRVGLQEVREIEEIPKEDGKPGVLLLGASEGWISRQVYLAGERSVHAITLMSRKSTPQDSSLSSVVMDVRDSMHLALDYMKSLGCRRLALYGVNPSSASDPWRAEIFRQLIGQEGKIFTNHISFRQLFEDFWKELGQFDGVICANDYAAISLIRHLRNEGYETAGRLPIISYGNLLLSGKFSPSITSISDNYELYGKAALMIYNMVIKEKMISSVSIQLRSYLHIRETTWNRPYVREQGVVAESELPKNMFYEDQEISRMAKLELMLNQCDDTDLATIQCLMQNDTYTAIAEKCFMSETATKYRIKKMEAMCGVSSREELAKLLKEFF
ncbi:MAG: substrate-binding domain-containing protein [Lachnospiraceae bacterium]|jgi:hypothetical protein|nr:substrate-binding domain-containing protein [Lachnospiraceae bacterium]